VLINASVYALFLGHTITKFS